MNYIKYFVFATIVLVGCTNEKKAEVAEWEIIKRFPNDSVKISHLYLGDRNDSTFLEQEFYPDGSLKSNFRYLNGKLEGKAIGYFPNGMPAIINEFVMGKEFGWIITFYENGIIRSKFLKKNGVTETGNYYFDNGQPTGCLLFDNKGQIVEGEYYYPNGNYRSEGKFYKQKKEGLWRQFHKTGTLKTEGSYNEGLKKGEWIYYDSLGVVEKRKHFK